jgi:endoglucanase
MRSCVLVLTLVAGLFATATDARPAAQGLGPACAPMLSAGVPAARIAALSRGFNLPGWLDTTKHERPDLSVLRDLRRRGLSHIRLPVNGELLAPEFSRPSAIEIQFAELDYAVDVLLALGFAVTLDMHPSERFGRLHARDPRQAYELIERLWTSLARRYRERDPDRLFFEALNEPLNDDGEWAEHGPRIAAAIRREAPKHTIIFGHTGYQRIDALPEKPALVDGNVVYAVHFYDPMIFTHQGMSWEETPLRYLNRLPFPARLGDPAVTRLLSELEAKGRSDVAASLKEALKEVWTEDRVAREIAAAADWAKRHKRPVMINEFGVLNWVADPSDRARWLRTVTSAAEGHCIGWTHWDYAQGFGFVSRERGREAPDETVLRALLGE